MRKAILTFSVPDRDDPSRSRSRPPNYRRDDLQRAIRRNSSAIQQKYGLTVSVGKELQDRNRIVVEIVAPPAPDLSAIENGTFMRDLTSGAENLYDVEITFEGENPDKTIRDKSRAVEDLVNLVSRWNSVAKTPEAAISKIDRAELEAAAAMKLAEDAEKRVAEMRAEAEEIKRSWINPGHVKLEDLAVILARRIGGEEYLSACRKYDEAFPQGLDHDIHLALISDRKTFAITQEIVELCSANSAAIDLTQSLEDIMEEASERSNEFEKSSYYEENHIEYVGAQTMINIARKDPKLVSEKILERAKELKNDFERNKELWEEKREAAHKAYMAIEGRSSLYDTAKMIVPDKSIDVRVPIVTFNSSHDGDRYLHIIIPTDRITEDFVLTRALKLDLTYAVREAVGIKDQGSVSIIEALGSKIIRYKVSKDLDEDPLYFDKLHATVKSKYRAHALNKLGVDISFVKLGDSKWLGKTG